MSARLAVVIPTRNRAPLLRRALESVPEGVEVVVVDDASIDGTEDIVRTYGRPITYIRLDAVRGPGIARNLGVTRCTADRILFLDDDDVILPEGLGRILAVADAHPDVPLHLHNCVWSSGAASIPTDLAVAAVRYEEWLQGRFAGELKPVARRDLFDGDGFEDTGASGEALFWGRVIRDSGAIVSGPPIVYYDVSHPNRLTSVEGLLARAPQNAAIADRWLEEFGDDQRALAYGRWRERVHAAVLYNVLAGRRRHALAAIRHARPAVRDRVACAVMVALPRSVLRSMFRLRRRALAQSAAHRG